MVMKANQIKPSALLATVVLGDVSPLVTEEGRSVYEYLNGERTENIKGYATELVLTNQNFEKVVAKLQTCQESLWVEKLQSLYRLS